jgi:hypothetical protein
MNRNTLRWLNTLRFTRRLKLKCVPPAIRNVLVEERLARIRGSNLVITSAGLKGWAGQSKRMTAYLYVN